MPSRAGSLSPSPSANFRSSIVTWQYFCLSASFTSVQLPFNCSLVVPIKNFVYRTQLGFPSILAFAVTNCILSCFSVSAWKQMSCTSDAPLPFRRSTEQKGREVDNRDLALDLNPRQESPDQPSGCHLSQDNEPARGCLL